MFATSKFIFVPLVFHDEEFHWPILSQPDMATTDQLITKIIKKCEQKKMKWKIIYNESARDTFKYEQSSPITENRFLDQQTPATINIYKDVVFIALWIKNPIAFRIKDKKVADSFKRYFEVMWNLAKE